MRLLGLILGMMMISTPSQSERLNLLRCNDIEKEMVANLAEYTVYHSLRSKIPTGQRDDGSFYPMDEYRSLTQRLDKYLTKASQFATIYNAKCK